MPNYKDPRHRSGRPYVRDILPPSEITMPVTRQPDIQEPRVSRMRQETNPLRTLEPHRLKFIIFAVLFFATSVFTLGAFSHVVVVISPKEELVDMESVIKIGKDLGDLAGEAVLFKETAEAEGKASGTREVQERASGRIVIFNAHSSEPQVLVRRTRFRAPDGKVYRIQKGITVPGAAIVDGKIEPRSIEVEVFADEPGEDYNIGLSDFIIPGFQGSAKYEKFYARSKTPMTGGFIGKEPVILEKDIKALLQALEDQLRKTLGARLADEVPDGFFVPANEARYTFLPKEVDLQTGTQSETFRMQLVGELRTFFVRRSDVEKKLLEEYREDKDFDHLRIHNFDDLEFLVRDVDFENLSLTLKVTGRAQVVWGTDEGVLREQLAAASSNTSRLKVFESYPQIRNASMVFKPFWWQVFPQNKDKIVIKEALSGAP